MTEVASPEPAAEPTVTVLGVNIEDVGVLPGVVVKVNELAEAPGATAEQMGVLILRDAVLTSKVLKMVNSSYYGLRQEVRSIQHAVAYLGMNAVRNLVVSSGLVEAFRFDHGVVEPRKLWEHSLGAAIGAKRLGDLLPGVHGDSAYLGALLHDLGRIVLISRFPEEYKKVIAVCERGLCRLGAAEEGTFEVSHQNAGFMLGRKWGFSDEVLAMVRYHHHPLQAEDFAPSAATVGFANAVCHQEGLRFGFGFDDEWIEEEKEAAWRILADLHGSDCPDRAEVDELVAESVQKTSDAVSALF